MTREQAIAIARRVADERGWPWTDPIHAKRRGGWLVFGRRRWEVRSNADMIGTNVYIVVDEATQHVITAVWLPR